MSSSRNYHDPCGIARTLGVVGERWSLLVIRELVFGPKRFTDLSRGLAGMSQNVLSQRLRELEAADILRQRRLGPPASRRVYELTERGTALEPILSALGRWGSRIPIEADDTTSTLSVDALVFALKTTFSPDAADTLRASYQLQLDDDRFHAQIGDRRFTVARGEAAKPDATIETDASTLRALLFTGRALTDTLHAGEIAVAGSHNATEHFLRCFPRPTPFTTSTSAPRST